MTYYYIHNDEFITSDTPLDANEYEIGEQKVLDYYDGKYILLDQNQIDFMNNNPKASPLEVFRCSLIVNPFTYGTKLSPVYNWYNENKEIVIINEETYPLFDWRLLLAEATIYKEIQRPTMTFYVHDTKFEGNTEDVYNFAVNYGVYNCDLDRCREKHFGYLEKHLDEVNTYDYRSDTPLVISVTFTKL